MRRKGSGPAEPLRLAAMLALLWSLVSVIRAGAFSGTHPLPRHARYAMVLDGQGPSGERALEGLRLLREGTIDTLVLSGTLIGGGYFYSMAWARMLPLSSPERLRTLELRSGCTSTMDEARMADSVFSGPDSDTVVVVTSSYHAWRAASILRRGDGSHPVFAVDGSPDLAWDGGMSTREGRKMRVLEWTKRAVWILWEQWLPVRGDPPWHAFVRGSALGEMPPPAWTP